MCKVGRVYADVSSMDTLSILGSLYSQLSGKRSLAGIWAAEYKKAPRGWIKPSILALFILSQILILMIFSC